jgi:ArsR family metal-binding transcriptional regulator
MAPLSADQCTVRRDEALRRAAFLETLGDTAGVAKAMAEANLYNSQRAKARVPAPVRANPLPATHCKHCGQVLP